MIVAQLFVACLVALACGSLVTGQDASPPSLQERWYNCRDNCENAVDLSRTPDFCTEPAFTTYYNYCLQCSGPDNYNIWDYYRGMGHLDSAGASCRLSTEPLSGKQPDVPEVGHPSSTTSAGVVPSTFASALTSTAPAQSSVAVHVSSSSAPTSGATGEASVSSSAGSVAVQTTTAASMLPSGSVQPNSSPTQTHSHAVSTKASGSSTTPTPSVAAANPTGSLHLEGAAGVLGAFIIGAIFGM